MKKKILFFLGLILFFTISMKLIDISLTYIYGLGDPIIYKYSKIYGYEIKPNQKIKRRGNKIFINNMGMRSSQNWVKNNLKNMNKILFFGDSVTYGGSIVSNKDLFSEKICKLLNNNKSKYICGNYGVNGFSFFSISQLIKYKKIDSDSLIVITLIGNDFTRSFHNIGSQPFWGKKINNFYPALTEILFIFIDRYRNVIKYDFADEDNFFNNNKKYYDDLFLNFTKSLEDKKYIIFYSPSKSEINGSNEYLYFKEKLSSYKNFFDLTEIKFNKKEELYHDHIHLNKMGHKVYADYMSKKIKKIIDENQ